MTNIERIIHRPWKPVGVALRCPVCDELLNPMDQERKVLEIDNTGYAQWQYRQFKHASKAGEHLCSTPRVVPPDCWEDVEPEKANREKARLFEAFTEAQARGDELDPAGHYCPTCSCPLTSDDAVRSGFSPSEGLFVIHNMGDCAFSCVTGPLSKALKPRRSEEVH